MRKTGLVLTIAIFISFISHAQLRVAIVGGVQQSKVLEKNDLPGWDTLKNNYSARTGGHFGIVADLPFGTKGNFSFQPGVIYYNKGRKFFQRFDTTTSTVISKSATQYINYIDVPLNLVLKFGKKVKFIIGGGPYASFFYSGKETSQTLSQGNIFVSDENNDLPVGNKPGKYRVIDYGVNGLAGLEYGRVFLTANYSRGLNDFYQSAIYTGTFRHEVMGVTLGIFLGKPVEVEKKKIKDSDNDGIPDNEDGCPTEPGTAAMKGCPDRDADGIADKDDKCPTVFGYARYQGCPIPDTDKDGINDEEDKCPTVFGYARYQGCPIPDTDKDGINDEEDKCPTIPGYARYHGCPIPDTDGDGVNDEEDKCPTVKGSKENNGCPVAIKKEIIEKVNFAARRIQFKFKRADLLPESYKVLDEVVKVLNENPELKLSIEGHSSSDGAFEANMKLSQERADNVKIYLQSKGVNSSRLKAKGFGSTQLLNNGKTEAEQSLNRRVELKLSN